MNEIRELTEMEVEAVSGGSPLVNIPITVAPQISTQLNIPVLNSVSIGGNAENLINGSLANSGSQLVGVQL